MTGLMLKDMYSLRTYFLKQLALMTVLYLAISVGLMKNFSFLSPMLTMSVVMMLISSFSVDEASSWDSYALTLPVTPRAIVGAKYLLFYGALLGTGVIASVLCGVLDSFTATAFLRSRPAPAASSSYTCLSPCSCCRCFLSWVQKRPALP